MEQLKLRIELECSSENNRLNSESNRLNSESNHLQREAHRVNYDTYCMSFEMQRLNRKNTEAAQNTSHTTRTNVLVRSS